MLNQQQLRSPPMDGRLNASVAQWWSARLTNVIVAAIPESALCAVFGGAGRMLRARAHGIDPRPVLPPERQAEFHVAHALATDTNDLGVLHPLLRLLGERLGRRLRRHGLVARRLRVSLTYADHTDAARAVPLHAAALDAELWDAARRAFTRANARRLATEQNDDQFTARRRRRRGGDSGPGDHARPTRKDGST